MNILIEKCKGLVQDLKKEGRDDRVIINALKEYLHYPVLDFVYNNSRYSNLVMYGGTLLRIAYDLPRMSEDLDFQTDEAFDFAQFKSDLTIHFKETYSIDVDVTIRTERLAGTDYAVIKFPFLPELGLKHSWTVLKVRFDVNTFPSIADFTTAMIPINKASYSFSIKTYPIATLMASKVAAVLLRNKRNIGKKKADCKPRDVFDLIWYMQQKIMPNMDYVEAAYTMRKKDLPAKDILELFDKLELRVLNLDDDAFRDDLALLFYDSIVYDDWHRNWKQRFQNLRNEYQIYRVKDLIGIGFSVDFSSDNRHFLFRFATDNPREQVKFVVALSEYWFIFSDIKIQEGHRRKEIEPKVANAEKMKDLDYEYVGLFYTKIENYLNRNNRIVIQRSIQTKLIRATGDRLNVKTQLFLNRRLLEKINFEDLI